uniref:Uncharacterized protein n=1 Tax=Romanomermis culicivorax TaxID=13658 RepID=A0A915JXG4_ROMCU
MDLADQSMSTCNQAMNKLESNGQGAALDSFFDIEENTCDFERLINETPAGTPLIKRREPFKAVYCRKQFWQDRCSVQSMGSNPGRDGNHILDTAQ